ncbi:MAG: SLC13 family permease [Verrucomicrobiales bacterium]|nr:SLC13 family permease [Verrucomicrobiales bacterium]
MSSVSLLLLGMLIVVISIIWLRWHPFISLIVAALAVAALTPVQSVYEAQLSGSQLSGIQGVEGDSLPLDLLQAHTAADSKSKTWFVSRVMDAFGQGCGGIALVIAMAAIIGKCLLDSGGARRIVESLMERLGLKRTPIAFAASAFTLGIPVFFDTVFYLLIPLAKALAKKTGKDYLLYILAIVAGATMAHSLVPPTPGPLTVASFFGEQVSIGSMMLGGLVLGLFTVSSGILYAYIANRKWTVTLPVESGDSLESEESSSELPAMGLSILPILLPVVLIGSQTILKSMGHDIAVMRFLGDKNIALLISAAAAVFLLIRSRWGRGDSRNDVRSSIQDALASGGVIILITAAGSAFGATLKDTGIAQHISEAMAGKASFWLIPVAYLTTALIRTAQGSATVAMITAGGMIAPIALQSELSFSALYLALAIGCGSKPVSWANDSGFWVIGRMSGMSPLETFRSVSVMMIVMSLVGLGVTMLGALLIPLV